MKHDPERNAASYLGGLLSGARRRMFERHMVDCEDCWREVDLGRKGRSVAESGRELAPQALRERVRAAVETVRPRRRRSPWVLGGGIVLAVSLVLTGVFLLLSGPDDPREIEAALAAFRTGESGSSVEPQLPKKLDELELVRSTGLKVGGVDAVVHSYIDSSGDKVVVYVAEDEWPVAAGAEHNNSGETWFAEKGGLVMICIDGPKPSLIVGDDIHDVELAAYSLRP